LLIFIRSAALAAVLALLPGAGSSAEEPRPVPYFVSLGSGEVNLRTGPGLRYPIDWVYQRRALPVEVIGVFDHWRQIRDWQGTEGWVHQNMLSPRRTLIVTGEERALRSEPKTEAPAIAEVAPGVLGEIRGCAGDWCEVGVAGRTGWLAREAFWGTYPVEAIE
jgi:SH3-like domain-containing protein